MRASTLSLLFGLVLLAAWTSDAQPHIAPDKCCFDFIDFPIPRNRIESALPTAPLCPKAGVVVTTIKKNEFCVKPDEAWVKAAMKAAPQ